MKLPSLLKSIRFLKILVLLSLISSGFILAQPILWPGGLGLSTIKTSIHILQKDASGNIVKDLTEIRSSSGKTLWDWLSLLGVPFSLTLLGLWFQSKQRSIQFEEQREEVLQAYIDRISALLIDKNLMAIASNKERSTDQKELLDASLHVIRAYTLSTLRRLDADASRRSNIIQFLTESEIFYSLKLDLSGAYLRDTTLTGLELKNAVLDEVNFRHLTYRESAANIVRFCRADLRGADLRESEFCWSTFYEANLSYAKLTNSQFPEACLREANLRGAKCRKAAFDKADMSKADMRLADCRDTCFIKTNLKESNLVKTNFRGANLRNSNLSSTNLQRADLCNTNLEGASLKGADLRGIKWNSATVWPSCSAVREAAHIPKQLMHYLTSKESKLAAEQSTSQ